eukprot:6490650-Amphidinium_carterae.1
MQPSRPRRHPSAHRQPSSQPRLPRRAAPVRRTPQPSTTHHAPHATHQPSTTPHHIAAEPSSTPQTAASPQDLHDLEAVIWRDSAEAQPVAIMKVAVSRTTTIMEVQNKVYEYYVSVPPATCTAYLWLLDHNRTRTMLHLPASTEADQLSTVQFVIAPDQINNAVNTSSNPPHRTAVNSITTTGTVTAIATIDDINITQDMTSYLQLDGTPTNSTDPQSISLMDHQVHVMRMSTQAKYAHNQGCSEVIVIKHAASATVEHLRLALARRLKVSKSKIGLKTRQFHYEDDHFHLSTRQRRYTTTYDDDIPAATTLSILDTVYMVIRWDHEHEPEAPQSAQRRSPLLQGAGKRYQQDVALRNAAIEKAVAIAQGVMSRQQVTAVLKATEECTALLNSNSPPQTLQCLIAACNRTSRPHEATLLKELLVQHRTHHKQPPATDTTSTTKHVAPSDYRQPIGASTNHAAHPPPLHFSNAHPMPIGGGHKHVQQIHNNDGSTPQLPVSVPQPTHPADNHIQRLHRNHEDTTPLPTPVFPPAHLADKHDRSLNAASGNYNNTTTAGQIASITQLRRTSHFIVTMITSISQPPDSTSTTIHP